MSIGFSPDTGGNVTIGPICVACGGRGGPLQAQYEGYAKGTHPGKVQACSTHGGGGGTCPAPGMASGAIGPGGSSMVGSSNGGGIAIGPGGKLISIGPR